MPFDYFPVSYEKSRSMPIYSSKIGPINTGDLIAKYYIGAGEEVRKLIGLKVSLNLGFAYLSLLKNGGIIEGLYRIPVEETATLYSATNEVRLTQGDEITLIVDNAPETAYDIFATLFIK